MHEYRVTYTIEVTADSPRAAVQQVMEILCDPEAIPPQFEVTPLEKVTSTGEATQMYIVDLADEETARTP